MYNSTFIRDLEAFSMGKALKRGELEELRDFNRQIQNECWYWR
jgi:hypothetical protein